MPTGHANRLLPSLRRVVLARQTTELSDGQLLAAFAAAETNSYANTASI